MTDQSGNVVAKYEYDAWGNVLSSNVTGIAADNPYGYAGYRYDKEIGMYYLMARYYHPIHGVFLTMDPDPGDGDNPITQNGYSYCNNNPVTGIDPDGHYPKGGPDDGETVYELGLFIAQTFLWSKDFETGGSKGKVKTYEQARKEALSWLKKRGFKSEKTVLGKFGYTKYKPIGRQTNDGKVGFRVEYDSRNGAHINVWAGKEKGPHFKFDASEKTVKKIQKRFR